MAVVLFAGVFLLRLAVEQSDIEVLLLCVLPIAVLAVEFGLLGALVGAGVAAVLLAVYVAFLDPEIGAGRLVSRVTVFALLAVLVASLVETLRRLAVANEQVERQSAARGAAERHGAEVSRLADEHRQLAEDLVLAEEETRRRIAEDLHDGPLQTLLAAKQDLIEASAGRAGVIRATEVLAAGIDDLRRAVGALHPVTIEHDGLAGALGALVAEAERRGRFRCELSVEQAPCGPHDHVLVAVARELLTNAVKHSGAGLVSVAVSRDQGQLCLTVLDDGCGLDATDRAAAPRNGHIGLASAERRVLALGGSLRIERAPQGGTAVFVLLPVEGERQPVARVTDAFGG